MVFSFFIFIKMIYFLQSNLHSFIIDYKQEAITEIICILHVKRQTAPKKWSSDVQSLEVQHPQDQKEEVLWAALMETAASSQHLLILQKWDIWCTFIRLLLENLQSTS